MGTNIKYRSTETEIMDDFALETEELRDALDKIAGVNRVLGGNKLTLNGVKQLLKKTVNREITIVDVGCGNGDMLRMLADYGKKENIRFKLIGIDANQFTVNYAGKLSNEYPNIEYRCINIFDEQFVAIRYDIVLCTLTLHHFTDDEILKIIATFNNNAAIGVVINDLHRSKTAYRLFSLFCSMFNLSQMSREDGLTSILKGFKKEELEAYSKKLNLNNSMIQWKPAFRYQWIISKI